jgi:hypothetical protein
MRILANRGSVTTVCLSYMAVMEVTTTEDTIATSMDRN